MRSENWTENRSESIGTMIREWQTFEDCYEMKRFVIIRFTQLVLRLYLQYVNKYNPEHDFEIVHVFVLIQHLAEHFSIFDVEWNFKVLLLRSVETKKSSFRIRSSLWRKKQSVNRTRKKNAYSSNSGNIMYT